MEVKPYRDPAAFQETATPIFLAHEARYCVAIGVASALVTDPEKWEKFYLGCIEQNGKTIAALLMTPPHPLSLTDMPKEIMPKVADYVSSFEHAPTGAIGSNQTADAFQDAWCKRSGAKVVSLKRQGIFQLEEVKLSPPTPGKMVVAGEEHFDLLLAWNRGFIKDCEMNAEHHLASERRAVELALKSKSRYLWIVENEPVAMAGASGQTPNGIRANWVYTPDHLRGKGYATKLVSKLSQNLLEGGNRFCFLYTDLANPTSNSIYQKIGYKRVGDSHHYEFEYAKK